MWKVEDLRKVFKPPKLDPQRWLSRRGTFERGVVLRLFRVVYSEDSKSPTRPWRAALARHPAHGLCINLDMSLGLFLDVF